MSTECGFCKGTGIEPGLTECGWCDNSGKNCGIKPDNIKRACSAIKSENKVHRYKVVTMLSAAGATIGYDPHGPDVVMSTEFDRVTAELATANSDKEAYAQNAIDLRKRVDALQQRLTAADERANVLSAGSALGDVHLERLRQIDVENRCAVDDDDYSLGQLAYAAAGYAQGSVPSQQVQGCLRPSYWPWHPRWWKPGSPRRMLVKAGALILAEIERLDRAALKPAEGGGDE